MVHLEKNNGFSKGRKGNSLEIYRIELHLNVKSKRQGKIGASTEKKGRRNFQTKKLKSVVYNIDTVIKYAVSVAAVLGVGKIKRISRKQQD